MPAEAMFDFVYDAQTLLTSVLGVLEFIIGISYVAGKYLTEGIVDVATVLWGFSKDVGAAMEFSLQLLVEVSQQLLQTAFLIYYAIGHIVDAFRITFIDLVSFLQHATTTMGTFIETCFYLILSSISSLVFVPDQLCSALSLIGDFFLGLCQALFSMIARIGLILISTPFQLLEIVTYLVLLPPTIMRSIPPTAYVGILALALSYFIYCRLSFRLFFRSSFNFLQTAFALFRRSGLILLNLVRKPRKEGDSNMGSSQQPKQGKEFHGICVVCFDQAVAFMATPCNHICVCKDCCYKLVHTDSRCPLCRKDVDAYHRVYIS